MKVQVIRQKNFICNEVAELEFPDGLDPELIRAEIEKKLEADGLREDLVEQSDPEYLCSSYMLILPGDVELDLDFKD